MTEDEGNSGEPILEIAMPNVGKIFARLIPVTFAGATTFCSMFVIVSEPKLGGLGMWGWIGASAVLGALAALLAWLWWCRRYQARRISVFEDRIEVLHNSRELFSVSRPHVTGVYTVVPARNGWEPFAWAIPELGGVLLQTVNKDENNVFVELAVVRGKPVTILEEQVQQIESAWGLQTYAVNRKDFAPDHEV